MFLFYLKTCADGSRVTMELNPELELVELVLTVDDLAFIVPPAAPDCTGVPFCITHNHTDTESSASHTQPP